MRLCLLLALLAAPAAAAEAPRAPLAQGPIVVSSHSQALIVKWRDEARGRTTGQGEVLLAQGVSSAGIGALTSAYGLFFEPWIDLDAQRLDDLERRAAERSGRAQPDLAGIHRVLIVDPTPERLIEVGERLAALPSVEFVAVDDVEVPPPSDTPDLVANQGWLFAERGLDAPFAWEVFGLDGQGVRLADCEYGWHREHEDLFDAIWFEEPGQTPVADVASRGWDHHGTAVAGQLVGQHNGFGIDGLAPAADFASYPEWTVEGGFRRGAAIAAAIADSRPGDVVLLEMQAGGPDGRFAPAEVNPAVFTIVQAGADAGVIVVGAAGNGSADLDSPAYETYRSWGHSGALIVGAGTADGTRRRMGFSTHGSRVDLHGWGQSVFTTGYGGFAQYGGDILRTYTATFGGTSSASPFVAGAATLAQQAALLYRTEPLDPQELRDLLHDTGKPAAAGARIGPFPDLAAMALEIERRFDIPPEIVALHGPERVDEGTWVELSVEIRALPTQDPQVAWAAGAEVGQGLIFEVFAAGSGFIAGAATLTDGWGRTDERLFEIQVDNVPPTLGPIQVEGDHLEGSALRLLADLFDPGIHDTHTWAWSIDGEPAGAEPVLEFLPRQDGLYRIQAIATDSDGGVSEPVTLDLAIADVPATLTLDVPPSARRRDEVALSVDIFDPGLDDVHTTTWRIGEPPVERQGERITFAFDEHGTVPIEVIVVDQDGVTSRAITTIEIDRRCGCATAPAGTGGLWLIALAGLGLARRRSRTRCPGAQSTAS